MYHSNSIDFFLSLTLNLVRFLTTSPAPALYTVLIQLPCLIWLYLLNLILLCPAILHIANFVMC